MRLQPNRDYISDDVVQTPPALARRLVEHFQPRGHILEPCAGEGNFLRAIRAYLRATTRQRITRSASQLAVAVRGSSRVTRHSSLSWCEIKAGRDFFAWTEKVDWIVTNPPWSQIRAFLRHGMKVADNIVFLLTINHVWTKARI